MKITSADGVNHPDMSRTHVGKAGEYYVLSMLLRLGLNAMAISVDSGVDIVAHKFTDYGDSLIYQHQVKTTEKKQAKFSISQDAFNRILSVRVNLIVVFWFDVKNPLAVVLPPSLLYMLTSGGFNELYAPIKLSKESYHFRLEYIDNNNLFLRNRFNNVAPMINRFDRSEDTTHDIFHIPDYAGWANQPKTLVQFED